MKRCNDVPGSLPSTKHGTNLLKKQTINSDIFNACAFELVHIRFDSINLLSAITP